MKVWVPVSFACIAAIAAVWLYMEYENRTYAEPMRKAEMEEFLDDIHYWPVDIEEVLPILEEEKRLKEEYWERLPVETQNEMERFFKGGIDLTDVYSKGWQSMEEITLLDDGSIRIDFSQNGFDHPSKGLVIPEFSHSEVIKIGQTFAFHCTPLLEEDHEMLCGADEHSYGCKTKGPTVVNFLQYLGVAHSPSDIPYHKFFHMSAVLQEYMPCDYHKVIKNSVDVIPARHDPSITYPGEESIHNKP